eukprot:scaffold592827_cov14-Prasinocladus_malaysianus.AAC.1
MRRERSNQRGRAHGSVTLVTRVLVPRTVVTTRGSLVQLLTIIEDTQRHTASGKLYFLSGIGIARGALQSCLALYSFSLLGLALVPGICSKYALSEIAGTVAGPAGG